MEHRTHPLKVPKGTTLFSPGQACPGFVVLRSGTIRVTLTAENGREVVLYRVRPGDVCLQTFSCLVTGEPYKAEGVAETDLTGDIVPPAAFEARLSESPEFRGLVFGAVAHRFAEFERLLEDVALTGFDARLARALLALADDDGTITATHEALATEIASGRAVVSRRLAAFAKDGIVTLTRGQVHITDRAKLEQIAADTR
jgi:CRP/FNR family transcriptional regulator